MHYNAREAKARAARMARDTAGRKTRFHSRKREASRKACRNWRRNGRGEEE